MSSTHTSRVYGGRVRWGRLAVAVGVLAVVLFLIFRLAAFTVGVFAGPDCVVTVGSRTVDLDSDQANRIAVAWNKTGKVTGVDASDRAIVAQALSGEAKHALSCDHGGGSSTSDDLNDVGLTARAERIHQVLKANFPRVPLGGFQPGGVKSGHMEGSAHYEGRAIDAFFRPINAANKQRGWAMAEYFVARAEALNINTVIFDGWIWTARRGDEGWRVYDIDTSGKSKAVRDVLLHRDHVHVDVAD